MADTDYFAQTTFVATATQTAFTIGFAALKSDHIKMAIDGVDETSFTIAGDLPGASATLTYTGASLSGGEIVRVYRRSPSTFATLGFQSSGSDPLTAVDLDTLVKGLLYLVQENDDQRKPQWVNKSSNFTVDPNSATAFALDTSSAQVTAALPAASSWRGMILHFKIETAGNALVIDGNTTDLIDGSLTKSISVNDAHVSIASDGDEWFVIAEN